MSSDGRTIVMSNEGKVLVVAAVEPSKPRATFSNPERTGVKLSACGTKIAIASLKSVSLYDVTSRGEITHSILQDFRKAHHHCHS